MNARRLPFASRFRTLPGWFVLLAAAFTLIMIGLGLHEGAPPPPTWNAQSRTPAPTSVTITGDQQLYLAIINGVAKGGSYYTVATDTLRANNYPLRPVFAVRLPTLAVVLAALPGEAARKGTLVTLIGVTLAAWGWRAYKLYGGLAPAAITIAMVFSGLGAGAIGQGYVFHECWMVALIALSLAIWKPERWWLSVLIGLAAVMIRELALGYLLAMAAAALIDKRWPEAAGWGIAILLFCCGTALHAHAIASHTLPGDPSSQGWIGMNGWPFVLLASKWCMILNAMPFWAIAIMVPLMLFGLIGWPGATGLRLTMIVYGYVLALLIVARPDNSYWALIVTPFLPLGLMHLPNAFIRLARIVKAADIARLKTARPAPASSGE